VPEQGVDQPAPPDVRPRAAQVGEDAGVGAAGLLQGVRQGSEAVRVEGAFGQVSLVVRGTGKGWHKSFPYGSFPSGCSAVLPSPSRVASLPCVGRSCVVVGPVGWRMVGVGGWRDL
jgi:hypothetical protein